MMMMMVVVMIGWPYLYKFVFAAWPKEGEGGGGPSVLGVSKHGLTEKWGDSHSHSFCG